MIEDDPRLAGASAHRRRGHRGPRAGRRPALDAGPRPARDPGPRPPAHAGLSARPPQRAPASGRDGRERPSDERDLLGPQVLEDGQRQAARRQLLGDSPASRPAGCCAKAGCRCSGGSQWVRVSTPSSAAAARARSRAGVVGEGDVQRGKGRRRCPGRKRQGDAVQGIEQRRGHRSAARKGGPRARRAPPAQQPRSARRAAR